MVPQLILKVQGLFPTFNPAEKKVATYLVDRADDVIHFSISDFAENAGCSEATVSRFVRRLGFDNFKNFKISLVRELSVAESQNMVPPDATGVEELIANLVSQGMDSFRQLQQLVRPSDIEKAADWFLSARRILFFGVGASGATALLGANLLSRMGFISSSYNDPHMQAMVAANGFPEDVVVGVSISGTIKDTVKSVQLARDAGSKTIAITGGQNSPLAQNADLVLYTIPAGFETGLASFAARASQMAVLDMVFSTMEWKHRRVANNLDRVNDVLKPKRF
ncbi:MAG TPA: MurR/RpiR family transcriptional regulator [Thermotogota bacterium]|nr:MurR/RpiR family transcriptional regulator [Thermotogota bacterium]HRW93285.1 MurR/RpiR family transcriptional regulator [Thermotogota bacterium]